MEYNKCSIDVFSNMEEPDENMLIGFDLTKKEYDDEFIIIAKREDYEDMADFKNKTGVDIAINQKEGAEPLAIIALFEKRKDILKLQKNKQTVNETNDNGIRDDLKDIKDEHVSLNPEELSEKPVAITGKPRSKPKLN